MIKYFLPIILLFILCNAVQAQISICELSGKRAADCLNSIQTAVPLLRTNLDASSGGMGDAGIAITSTNNAIFYNSASMVFNKNDGGISLNFVPWLRFLGITDIYLTNFTAFEKINEFHAVSASIRYLNLGELNFDHSHNLNKYKPKELFVDFAYAYQINEQFSVGANLKYIQSDLLEGQTIFGATYQTGKAIAADLSAFYTKEINFINKHTKINAGISLSNIGNKISYIKSTVNSSRDCLPTNLGIGTAVELNFNNKRIIVAYDANKLLVSEIDTLHIFCHKKVLDGIFASFTDTPPANELQQISHGY